MAVHGHMALVIRQSGRSWTNCSNGISWRGLAEALSSSWCRMAHWWAGRSSETQKQQTEYYLNSLARKAIGPIIQAVYCIAWRSTELQEHLNVGVLGGFLGGWYLTSGASYGWVSLGLRIMQIG